VTWFDTALSYGWGASHAAVKTFLGKIGDRDTLWITSKSGSRSPGSFETAADKALAELGTDYLNVYLMHGNNHEDMLEPELIAAGERLKKAGKTQFFGFSAHGGNVVELMDKAAKVGGIDVILFRYNFRRYGDGKLNLAIDRRHKTGIGLLAMKTQGSGPGKLEAVADFRARDFSLAQAKLKSVWADERVTSICSEMDTVALVRENAAAPTSNVGLSANESHQLNQLAHLTADCACLGCSHHCERAAGGSLAIEEPLRYLMYHECYGKPERARELYHGISNERRIAHSAALQAASAACPQSINIAAPLEKAHALLA
jgi:predicted aldo/keto reductase-like oxidoreductase